MKEEGASAWTSHVDIFSIYPLKCLFIFHINIIERLEPFRKMIFSFFISFFTFFQLATGIMALNGDQSQQIIKEIITTTSCKVREETFQARLELLYYYKVEYIESLDLVGIERALATSIASALNYCDENMEPLYAVELTSPSHIKTIAGNECFNSLLSRMTTFGFLRY